MKEPIEPNKEDCCDSGCNPCIFDVYEKQLMVYKLSKERGGKDSYNQKPKENAMSQLEYKSYCTVKNIDFCQQHQLLFFKQLNLLTDKTVYWSPGEHFLVKYSFEKQSCTRAYTPIKLEQSTDIDYDFAIIVKRYVNGLVSKYLCNLKVGEQTMWRGPYGHYTLNSELYTRVVMIAQGTGLAPFISIIKYILNNEDSMTRIFLFYCCLCVDTILFREELYMYKSNWNFKYIVHLSKRLEGMSLKYQEPISTTRLTSMDIMKLEPFSEKDQFLLCGSDHFMKHYSKCLQEKNVQIENIVTF